MCIIAKLHLIVFNLILCLLIITESFKLGNDDDSDEIACGSVAVPFGTEAYIYKKEEASPSIRYDESDSDHNEDGTQVVYRCTDPNNQLVGNDLRTCRSGKWMGTVPRCAINYLNQTALTLIEVLDTKLKSVTSTQQLELNDYNHLGAFSPPHSTTHPQECVKWKISEEQLWILNVNKIVDVHYIRMVLYGENIRPNWAKRHIKFKVQLNNLWGVKCTQVFSSDHYYQHNASDSYISVEFVCEPKQASPKVNNKMHAIFVNFSAKSSIKKLMVALCDLRVYHFRDDCGTPDHPIMNEVRHSFLTRNEYIFLCLDNDHVIEGNTRVRCGANGKWLDDFPSCVAKHYCHEVDHQLIGDSNVQIAYELRIENPNGGPKIIPDGKIANFSCRNTISNSNDKQMTLKYELRGKSEIICRNGKWRGLSADSMADSRPHCVSPDSLPIFNTTNSMSNKIVIRVLSGVLIVCLIIIACLVVYMYASRKLKARRKLSEVKSQLKLNNEYEVTYYENLRKTYEHQSTQHIYEYITNDYENIVHDYAIAHNAHNNDNTVNSMPFCHNNLMLPKDVNVERSNSIYSNFK